PLVDAAPGLLDHDSRPARAGTDTRADRFTLDDLAASAVREFDREQQQGADEQHDRRGEGPVRVLRQADVDVVGVHARSACFMSDSSRCASSPPANRRSVTFSNSSPQPELSVRASPPSSTLTVPGSAGTIRIQTRRRRTTSDTSRPAIIVSANTSTHTWAGSWDTCTLMNGSAPSNRTTVPSSRRVDSPAPRLTRAFLV